jgi:3-deoxy-D-manno-octulosonic-acid transferase
MRIVLDLIYILALLVASPWLLYGLVRSRAWSAVPARFGLTVPDVEPGALWLHGSSVGEVGLLAPLISAIEAASPGARVVVSSFTSAGIAAARQRYPQHVVVPLPFDFSFVVRRVLRRLDPGAVVIVESDIWPNFADAALRREVPVAVLNARMSPRSFDVYRRTGLLSSVCRRLTAVGAQGREHAARFAALGVPASRIAVTGNMKYDLTPEPDAGDLRERMRATLAIAKRDVVLIGASLHPPEDEAMLVCFATVSARFQGTRLILVPRYPADGRRMAEHARARGFETVLKSQLQHDDGQGIPAGAVIVADTLGELRALYHAADIAYVGGSLHFRGANKGGHNLMEPAILGIPVIFGPYNFSFRETVADLLAADAGVLVRRVEDLTSAVARFLASPIVRMEYGQRARDVVLRRQGATARSLELIAPLLPPGVVAGHRTTDDNAAVHT